VSPGHPSVINITVTNPVGTPQDEYIINASKSSDTNIALNASRPPVTHAGGGL